MSAHRGEDRATSSARRSRARKFVKGGGALVVGLSLVGAGGSARRPRRPRPRTTLDPTLPSSWLEIHADNTILMRTGKVELGQGSASTAYAQIIAEELNVPYSAITKVVMGDTDRTPDGGFSAGYMGGGNPNLRKVGRVRLPGAAQPGLDAARRPGRRTSR